MENTPSKTLVLMPIEMPTVEDMGPALRACTEKQRKFVVALYHSGQRERAYVMAGYSASSDNLVGTGAHGVFHNPKVQEAIREYGRDNAMGALIPQAFMAIEEALRLGDIKEKTKAAGMVFDRTGFHAMQEMKITKVGEDRVGQIKEIIKLAKEQGLDPRTLIGNAVDFVDADFEVLERSEGAKPIEAETSFDGLEDLI